MNLLQNAHVLIVGIGGVGSWTAEALARSGVGHLTLIDWDTICFSNINRQIHATSLTAGRAKVQILADRIQQINPDCKITPIQEFYSDQNAEKLISTDLSYVVDAIDKKNAKIHLITHCKKLGIPIVVSGGAGGKIDPSKIRVTDLRDSHNDPLLAHIRKQLRRNLGMRGQHKKKFHIPCVFSEETIRYPTPEGGIRFEKPEAGQLAFGAATFVTGSFGFAMAARILKDLTSSQGTDSTISFC